MLQLLHLLLRCCPLSQYSGLSQSSHHVQAARTPGRGQCWALMTSVTTRPTYPAGEDMQLLLSLLKLRPCYVSRVRTGEIC